MVMVPGISLVLNHTRELSVEEFKELAATLVEVDVPASSSEVLELPDPEFSACGTQELAIPQSAKTRI